MINFLFTLFFLIAPFTIFAESIKDTLNKISSSDRESMKDLFYTLMQKEHGAYMLFGDKPLSLSGDFIITPFCNLITGHQCGGVFWKNWNVWKKYESLFPHANYLIVEESSYNHKDIVHVIFINKKHFINKVNVKLIYLKNF